MTAYKFLDATHPAYDHHRDEWTRRERLMRGGLEVVKSELERFEWEAEDGEHYQNRIRQATFPAFGALFAERLIGHVLQDRPETDGGLSFGRMGLVERSEGVTEPSQAEQVFYNINGTGGDGQQFWQWIADVFKRAAATGMRWVLVEAPAGIATSRQDELDGMRPYAVEFSPRVVTNWKIERGTLQWCIIRTREDTRRVEGGIFQGEASEQGYYLLVRRGVQELGPEFEAGGWWKFNKDREPTASGTWDKTRGEIPMAFAIWEWEADDPDEEPLPLARSGTTALDNLSVAYMNAKSAWRSNMWRSAGGPTMLLGVDAESWEIAKEQWVGGTSLMGVPSPREGRVSVAHSGAAAVTSGAFAALLEDMTDEAERLMLKEVTSTPDSSGRAKSAGFMESKAPRLTVLAENMEGFINTLLRYFELRFGLAEPGAYVQMPRDFDLTPIDEDIRSFFETFRTSQLRSATLEAEAMTQYAESKGLINDGNRDTVRAELQDSADAERREQEQSRAERAAITDALRRGRQGQGNEEGEAA